MHIAFVTTELARLNPGGAGSVVAQLRDRLMARGDRVSVILVAEHDGTPPDGVTVVGTAPSFESRSLIASEALQRLVSEDRPDLVEIQDFDGLAFGSLTHRTDIGIDQVPTQIRFHGPADLMFEAIGAEPPEIAIARLMESACYRMADRVLVPSPGIGFLATERYGLDAERVLVSTPPLPEPRPLRLSPSPQPTFVCIGRLGEVKGTHDLVQASLPILSQDPGAKLVLIGEDGWSATADMPMGEWLIGDVIPADLAPQIELTGRMEGEELDRWLSRAWAVVVPSRFESFNLAAHEARGRGLPVIVPDISAFSQVLDEGTGALVYGGTVPALTEAMRTMISDADLRQRLASAPLPAYGDPLAGYNDLPQVRHPRSQSGLATESVKRIEQHDSAQPQPVTSRKRRVAANLLDTFPAPLAARVIDVLPTRWTDRFGFIADWRQIQMERSTSSAAGELADRIAAGDFPDLEDPLVSVVIPCYNHGVLLDEAISSVFHQTFDSYEIVVVDDGSTESDTIETIDNMTWPRTSVIRTANRGLAAARNTGISAARGTFVVPLDADDALEPAFLERLIAALADDSSAGYATCRSILFGDVEAIWYPRPFNAYQLMMSNSNVGCVLLRRDAWEAVGGYDESMRNGNEDWEFWIRLMVAGWGIVEVPEYLFRYRKHGISMSVHTEARFEEGRAEVVDRHRDLYDEDRLRELKSEFYPFVSIIIDGDADTASLDRQTLADAEIIAIGPAGDNLTRVVESHGWPLRLSTTVDEAVGASRGKHISRWSDVSDARPDTLERLAEAIERDPMAGMAISTAPRPLTVVRRWSLHDPHGPSGVRKVEDPATAHASFDLGQFPDPAWIVPSMIEGLPVQRQRPEEDGRLPSWVPNG